ncbi:hypothetical protein [Algimonas arctica]|uniref:hypothetical protein n=1 Tax=Algimonas arctica TaxID=1479486 RepID=UPI001678929E|nr:hypothetical protein [Algimonas arctica]
MKFPDGSTRVVPGYLSKSEDHDGLAFHANLVIDQLGDYEIEIARCSGEKIAIRSTPCEDVTVVNRVRWTAKDRDRRDFPPISALTQGEFRYLMQDGTPFLKTGAGSPENILAYADFDGTYDSGGATFPALGEDQLHKFEPHLKDARADDPTWDDGKGAALLGLFNYYEEVGVNSQYLVGMNIHGDGGDVSPWVVHDDPYVFDVSKLAQWQAVFEHANKRGVAIHFFFTETENESFFETHDGMTIGEGFAPSRKLYYREMVARFGHLPMIIWNLGEENGVIGNSGEDPYRQPTSPKQRGEFADYIATLDTRGHPIVAHNWPDAEAALYSELLGRPSFSGISLQAHDNYFDKIVEWTEKSAAAGRPWMVSVDEPLGWEFGARPDAEVERRNEILTVLWPAFLAGGAGVEWYFGWQNNAPTSDLSNEDQRSRDALWRASTQVRQFFETLPLTEMSARRDGDMMVFEGGGHRLEMVGETVTYTAPNDTPRALDTFNPI